MKKTLLCLALVSSTAFAAPIKTLTCSSPHDVEGFFEAKLNPNAFDSGSGLYAVSGASVSYQYSSANLNCVGNTPDALGCIGYWFNSQYAGIAEVQTFKDDKGNISAKFKTVKAYGNLEVTIPCKIN